MIGFWCFFFVALVGILIGAALRDDLITPDPHAMPPATARRIRRAQRAARADLRGALGDRVVAPSWAKDVPLPERPGRAP